MLPTNIYYLISNKYCLPIVLDPAQPAFNVSSVEGENKTTVISIDLQVITLLLKVENINSKLFARYTIKCVSCSTTTVTVSKTRILINWLTL